MGQFPKNRRISPAPEKVPVPFFATIGAMSAAPRVEGYRTQAADTDPDAERWLFDRLRALAPWQKAAMLSAASRAAYGLAIAGLRLRYPQADEAELRKRYAALTLGRDASLALLGWDPEREGW